MGINGGFPRVVSTERSESATTRQTVLREVVVHLGAKLGARVLINLDASPIPVIER
jgi:hypothetical protein